MHTGVLIIMLAAPSVILYIASYLLWSRIPQITANNELPPNFPSTIPIEIGTFQNWSNEITVNRVWIATPATAQDVVTLANWAYDNGYKLRALGYMHNWSPLTVTVNDTDNLVLVDTKNLIKMSLSTSTVSSSHAVTVEAGASMLDLLTYLEKNGFGLYSVPAPGDISVGGALAINGHGTGIPAVGETVTQGHAYGTLSNLIISITAVVWNTTLNEYNLNTFQRSNADAKVFLVHFGRTFVTQVTLMVGANYNLRCQSMTDISSDELFAEPTNSRSTRTFASFLDASGRVESIRFPFTSNPWLKVWSITPTQPLLSRKVSDPFNYLFSDIVPEEVSNLVSDISNGVGSLTPLLGLTQFTLTVAGLKATLSSDIWGPSKNLLLYVKPTTLRLTANGYAVATKRSNVQKVISATVKYYDDLVNDYAQQGLYPLSGPMEIRATSLDQPGIIPNGESPAFSSIHPINNHPEYDVAVWFDVLCVPGTENMYEALTKFEWFMFSTFNGTYASVRPEWSKGWAYTDQSAFTNSTVYGGLVPASFPANATSGLNGWNWAVSRLNSYDPYGVFTNAFLDSLLQPV